MDRTQEQCPVNSYFLHLPIVGSDSIAALLGRVEPYGGLITNCVGIGTTLTFITETPTVGYEESSSLLHVR